MEEKHCSNCGAPIPFVDGSYAKFCTHCGTPTGLDTPEVTYTPPTSNPFNDAYSAPSINPFDDSYSAPGSFGGTAYSAPAVPVTDEDRELASKGLFNIEACTRKQKGMAKDWIAGIACSLLTIVMIAFYVVIADRELRTYFIVLAAIFFVVALGSITHAVRAKKIIKLVTSGVTSVSEIVSKAKFRSRRECMRVIKKMIMSCQLVGYRIEAGERIIRV